MRSLFPFFKRFIKVAEKALIVLVVTGIVIALFSFFMNKNKITISDSALEKNKKEVYKTLKDPKLTSTKEGRAALEIYRVGICGFVGEACNPKQEHSTLADRENSFVGKVSSVFSAPYGVAPASGVGWVYNSLEKTGFVPRSYAAEGIGFASLKPIQNLWKIFRDFSFLVVVLILVIIGFMIMFRVKINPQTIIALENSLPRIVITLLLITFSFAIAGFMIDIMYIAIMASIDLIAHVNVGDITVANIKDIQNDYIGAGMTKLWPISGGSPFNVGIALVNILPTFIRGTLKGIVAFLITTVLMNFYGRFPAAIVDIVKDVGVTAGALTFIGGFNVGNLPGIASFFINLLIFMFFFPYAAGILVGLVVVFTLFFFIFRVFFMLFASYIKILLLVIFGPLILLVGAFPGRNMFLFWLKNLVSELVIFPLVIGVLLLGAVITSMPLSEGQLFRPPFLYDIDSESFAVLLGMGIILLIPNLIKKFRETLGFKGPGLGFSPGVFFSGATGAWKAGSQQALQLGQMQMYAKNLPWLRNLQFFKRAGE